MTYPNGRALTPDQKREAVERILGGVPIDAGSGRSVPGCPGEPTEVTVYECENCDDTGTCPCGGSGCDGCDRNDPGRCRCHQRPARGDICQEGCHESCLCNVGGA